MRYIDMVRFALKSLYAHLLRSSLTMLGIVIGITTVIVLIALVQGARDQILWEFSGFGPRTILITPGDASKVLTYGSYDLVPTSGKLFEKDLDRIKNVEGIETISKALSSRFRVEYKLSVKIISAYGVEPDQFKSIGGSYIEIENGRFLIGTDRKTVVIGHDLAESGFSKEVVVGSVLNISGEQFRVVGIMKRSGSAVSQLDNTLIIPFDDAKELIGDSLLENEIHGIRVLVKEGEDPDAVASEIERALLVSHHTTEDKKDFYVLAPSYANEVTGEITDVLAIFLGSIATLSLIVGSIGISNTMFMSVIERTREIGLLKSIGMEKNTILMIFLIESSLIGLVGCTIGIPLSYAILWVADMYGIQGVILPEMMVGVLFFSAVIGLVSGYFPARKAQELSPVQSLRYE